MLREYDTVRVARLLEDDRDFSGTDGVARPPRVGDIAVICHEYEPGNPSSRVAVEMVDADGRTIWVADFNREELVLVPRS